MITLALIIFAAICNAIMDTLMVFFTTSRFRRLNPLFWDFTKSQGNKWKNGDRSQGERFIGSSTWFVSFTDAWHLFKTMLIVCCVLAIVFYIPIFGMWDILIYISVWCGSFELSYRFFKKEI